MKGKILTKSTMMMLTYEILMVHILYIKDSLETSMESKARCHTLLGKAGQRPKNANRMALHKVVIGSMGCSMDSIMLAVHPGVYHSLNKALQAFSTENGIAILLEPRKDIAHDLVKRTRKVTKGTVLV